MDAFVDLFITTCIILNTLCMALDQPGQSDKMTRVLTTCNYIFTSIFTVESTLKIIALTPAKFVKSGWNVFDLLVVTVSLIELGLANVKGLSVLRSFRLVSRFHTVLPLFYYEFPFMCCSAACIQIGQVLANIESPYINY